MRCETCTADVTPLPTRILAHKFETGHRFELGAGPIVRDPEPVQPCQLQASPFCEHVAVMERLDPMAMAPMSPAPVNVIPTCLECFEHRSDQYLRAVTR
jgi:hypothetical protein